jgi:hypothetical protein
VTAYAHNGTEEWDKPMADLLRNLSQVSTVFRQGFGRFFWAKARLEVDREFVSFGKLPSFFWQTTSNPEDREEHGSHA